MSFVREIGWDTWGPVSSGFREIELRGDRLEYVGHVAPFVAPADRDRGHERILEMAKDSWKDPDPQPGDFDAELDLAKVEIHEGNPNAELSILTNRRASRATEMRALLRHARPHGGNAAEQVKQARPRSTRD